LRQRKALTTLSRRWRTTKWQKDVLTSSGGCSNSYERTRGTGGKLSKITSGLLRTLQRTSLRNAMLPSSYNYPGETIPVPFSEFSGNRYVMSNNFFFITFRNFSALLLVVVIYLLAHIRNL